MAQIGLLTSFDHNSQTWQVFKARLTQWFVANDIGTGKDSEDIKRRAILLSALSDATFKLAADLALPKDLQTVPYSEICVILDNHFTPKSWGFSDRYKFYSAVQFDGESYTQWAARLRGLTAKCGFLNVEEALRDHFIMGMLPGTEREKLFAQNPTDLTLAKAVELAESVRSARAGAAAAQGASCADQLFKISSKSRNTDRKCSACGSKNHTSEKCRFANYKCKKCHVKGHLRRMCKEVNFVGEKPANESGDDGEFFNIRSLTGEPMTEVVDVRGVQLKFQIDSGSAVTAIPEQTYLKNFSDVALSKTSKRLLTYTGNSIHSLGLVRLPFTYNGKTVEFDVFVIRGGAVPLLGRDFISLFKLEMLPFNFCEQANLLEQLRIKFPKVFSDELGTFKNYKIKLELVKDAKPIFFKARPVAFALRDKMDKELERLVSVGILKPVEHSAYASPVVPVLKRDGSLRLCADYSVSINKQLVVQQYPLPTAQELFAKLHGGQQFTKLDLSQAYAQCVLDEESQEFTCINTHRGLFKYTRLVFGLASAPAIFQRVMEELLAGMEGVLCMLDDILVTGRDKTEHLNRLYAVLQRLENAGLTLQKSKCEFYKDEVEYLGYVVNKDGLKKSPAKVSAILNAPVPEDVSKLQSFLGLVNYYRAFVPGASSVLSPLYNLLQKGSKWQWGTEHDNAFKAIKRYLASDLVLAHFDANAKVILTVDAGPSGLGAVLSLVGPDGLERPVAYASRTLNAAEKKYSQIQKEATAIIFGVRRFHQYLYGRAVPFVLRTDHKPLTTIFGPHRGIPEVSANRLQRYALFLSAYNYTIEYIRSADNSADYLSRASVIKDNTSEQASRESAEETAFVTDRASYVNFVVDASLPITLRELRDETQKDPVLSQVSKYICNGWPRKVSEQCFSPYQLCKNQLSFEDGVIMRGHKVVIPGKLQSRILSELHKSHLGIVKCKAEARGRVWFPGIDKAIEGMIASCGVCNQLRASPPRAPLAVWPYPPQAFFRVHADFLGPINNQSYLVLVDAYSKWVEVYRMNSTSTTAFIAKLYEFMSRFGLIHTLVSDNATCFSTQEFKSFCLVNGISHVTSPAYHPASNGQAESYVKVVKRGIRSCIMLHSNQKSCDENLLKYLFDYRNSIHATTGLSPAEIVFGRKLRTRLDLLNSPPSPISSCLNEVVERNQSLQCKAHGGTERPFFKPGDYVNYKKYSLNKKFSWNKGIVVKKIGKTLYLVKDIISGLEFKKHVNQLTAYKGKPSADYDVVVPDQPAVAENNVDGRPREQVVDSQAQGGDEEQGINSAQELGVPSSGDLPERASDTQVCDVPRAGLSGMLLRPIPRVSYKPFYCLNI